MIAINTTETDHSSSVIIEIMKSKGFHDIIRINDSSAIRISIELANILTSTFSVDNSVPIKFSDLKKIWIRKKGIFHADSNITNRHIHSFTENELQGLLNYLEQTLYDRFVLSRPEHVYLNKLSVLHSARELGICVPESWIINSRDSLSEILNHTPSVVFKPISDIIDPASGLTMLTKRINQGDMDSLPRTFGPTLVQECIESNMEVRSVYLLGDFYTSILSPEATGSNDRIRDFRSDKAIISNLYPYKLPASLKTKLRMLLKSYKIDLCSIDMILRPSGNHVFLELNPFGQFGMVSSFIAYPIEDKIANYLMSSKI